MDKICLLYIPGGLGDCLFSLKGARYFQSQGYRIIWPIISEYAWVKDYIPDIEWVSWEDDDFKLNNYEPLADHIKFPYKEFYNPHGACILSEKFVYINGYLSAPKGMSVMDSKYKSMGIPYENWQEFVLFNRNKEKENDLFYNVLQLKDNEDYVLVNRNFQMRPKILKYPHIRVDPSWYGKKVIEMDMLKDFTLFDWLKVVENASAIWMIESSLNYIMESPLVRDNLKAIKNNELNLFSRRNDFCEVQHLFKLPWKYWKMN